MFSSLLLYLFYLIIHDDGKLYRKNPFAKKKYNHVATFPPEKRIGGIIKNWLHCLLTFTSPVELYTGTKEAIIHIYQRFAL